ncbi:MAG: iron ABC transporter permease [Gammaproteobacteria bacterium RIFCSPLOWO2_02_FULL_57_10]|nr:MAG: iron ABC transporter permease [Gammaproteobacteria bacterium RIFCSPLOWO2_02_FULL_57_10]
MSSMINSLDKAPEGALSSLRSVFSNRLPTLGILLVCILLSVPVLTILASVTNNSDGVWQHLYETVLGDYVTHSLTLLVGVGLMVLLLGIGPAWLVTMTRFPGSRVLEWALVLPLAMPAYIIAYTYTGMLDVGGPLQMWIRETFDLRFGEYWFPQIRSLNGAVVMLSLVLYPYVYLLSRMAFIEQSVCVLEVSRTLGATPFKAFTRVAIPLARPAIIAGLSLVLMETLADYGTVQYFGVSAFTTGIFRTWFGLGSLTAAAQLAAVLMIFILFLILAEHWSRQKARYHHTSNKYTRLPRIELTGWKRAGAMAYCILPVLLGFVIPFVQLSLWAVDTWHLIDKESFLTLFFNSLELASITAVIALLLGLLITYTKRLRPTLATRGMVRVLGLGYAIPGTVIAVGVLIPFAWFDNTIDAWMREYFDISTGLLLSGTLVAVVFAYLVRFLPVSLNTLDAGLGKIKPTMDDVGRSMGLRPLQILRRVHMPIMRGSLLTASLLVFVDVLKELPATLILRPFNFNTLAIRTYELANQERLAEASSTALMIVLAGIIPVIILSQTISRSRPGHDAST